MSLGCDGRGLPARASLVGEAPYGVDAAFPAVEDEARPTMSAGGVARRCGGRSLAHAAWWAGPVLISLAVILPRLLSAQFGLLDDARTLVTARDITSGSWDMSWDIEAGRFRPGYWLFPALLYALVGQNPVGFFAGNAALFAGTTAALVWLAPLRGGGRGPGRGGRGALRPRRAGGRGAVP